MDIRFPELRESELIELMKSQATPPWKWQGHDAFGRQANSGSYYFHRDGDDKGVPPCTVCIDQVEPGHFIVQAIVPDENSPINPIPDELCMCVIREFDEQIAESCAGQLEGITMVNSIHSTIDDLFSPESIRLLRCFCDTSNQGDLGTHLSDQEKWIAFLLQVYEDEGRPDGERVHCDAFGDALRSAKWWPEARIRGLVNEFDFALRLLRQEHGRTDGIAGQR